MKKERKLNIWTIVILVIAIFLIGLLVYNWLFAPSQAISATKFEAIINQEIKKKFAKTPQQLQMDLEGEDSSLKVVNNKSKFIIKKIDIYRPVYATVSIAVEYLNFSGKTNKISFILQQEDFVDFKKRTFDLWEKSSQILIDKKVISHTSLPISLLSVFLSYLPTLLILLWIFFIFFRSAGGGLIGGLSGSFKATELTKTSVRFQDVAGIVEEKKELLEIVSFLKKPGKYLKMGARIPKGLLLFGPPGTGKTLLAKAVSGESNVPFFSVSGSEFEEVLVGLGASRIRQLFKKAKQSAPCIIFIDEIDSLGSSRSQGISGVKDQTLNQFLAAMDGFDNTIGVVIIAATNRADVLDPALLRSGRFDRKIQISLPNVKEREEILKIHSRNKNLANDVNFTDIAHRTPGFTGAQLENSLNEAALLAVRKDKTMINSADIDEGIDRVIGGPAKYSQIVSEKTRLLVSIHESGHALMGLLVSDASKVQKITIIPRGAAGGYTIITPKDETRLYSKQILEDQLIGILGGRAAEEAVFGTSQITTGGHDDFSKASTIAQKMVQQFGMSPAGLRYFPDVDFSYPGGNSTISLSEYKKKENDRYIDWILEDCFVKAKKIVWDNLDLLYLLAEALLILETITSEEIEYIYQNKKLPERILEIKKKNSGK